jgi:tubulin-specific chaperone D
VQCIGLLQVLCEVAKSGPAEQIQKAAVELFAVAGTLEEVTTLNNTAVRKYKTKLLARTALRMLPARLNVNRRGEYKFTIYFVINDDVRCSSCLNWR